MHEDIRRGKVFYAKLDPIIGSEEGGIRPVLILQNNASNMVSPTTIVAPITCQTKRRGHEMHVLLPNPLLYPGSMALLEQIRTIDKSRLRRFVCTISENTMRTVERAIHTSLGLKFHTGG